METTFWCAECADQQQRVTAEPRHRMPDSTDEFTDGLYVHRMGQSWRWSEARHHWRRVAA